MNKLFNTKILLKNTQFFVNQIVHCEDIRADLEMVQVPGQ